MAITSAISSGPYAGTGSQTAFPFSFSALSSTDVIVKVDNIDVSTACVVAITSGGNSGTVTFSTAPALGAVVLIEQAPDFIQDSQYGVESNWSLSSVNAINRRAAMRANWLRVKVGIVQGLPLDTMREKRLRTLNVLADSIARTGGQLPTLAATLPTIGAATAGTAIATGTTWSFEPATSHDAKYTFVGGTWGAIGATFPNNQIWKGVVSRNGNGTDPTANPIYGGRVRFSTEAPILELFVQCAASGAGDGFRLKVDGQYVKTGVLGNDGNGLLRYIPITWGAGAAADRKVRHYELEFGNSGAFLGIRTGNLYKPSPWPQSDGLKVLMHGDSFVWTIVDSGTKDNGLAGAMGQCLGTVLGQSDFIGSGTGGAGMLMPANHLQSWFNDRVNLDVVTLAPDVIIETGGGNDESPLTVGTETVASYQARWESWLSAVLTAKPETIIFMTGPLIGGNAALGHTRCKTAKAAAAAKWPKNVVFIDNLTDPWVSGTGKQGTTTGDGNRDWMTGSDGAHPTMEGHPSLAGRINRATSSAIKTLIAAQG